jgi:two-component system sensor histidine kinase KdpD
MGARVHIPHSMNHLLRNGEPASPAAYGLALLMVAASTLAGFAMAPRWGTGAVDLIYLPVVLAAAAFGGLGPALLAAIAAALTYNFFFTAPFHTFRIHSPADIVTVVVLFAVALVTSQLAASIRAQARLAEAHAARNATIAGFARQLLGCAREMDIAAAATAQLSRLFECNAALLDLHPQPRLVVAQPPQIDLNPSDLAIAALVAATGEPAGRGITPATTVQWQFHAVRSQSTVVALIGLARDDGAPPVAADRMALLDNIFDQVALALERARVESEARGLAALRERDMVRSALLSSIGQDLTAPLDALATAVSDLRREGLAGKGVISEIARNVAGLKRYLDNLSSVAPQAEQAPIEAGQISIDLFRRSVLRDGEQVHLTPKEYAVLSELARHRGRVLSHAHLLRTAWGPAQEKQAEYLRVAIRGLRQKLEADPTHPSLIVNEPAVGYRLNG